MKKLILTAYTEIDQSIVEYELTNIEASKNDVSSVVLNTETTSIQQNTFKDFSNLSIVYNIEKVTSIYDNAFENTALTGNLTLNKNTTLIGKHAFKGTKIVRAIVDKATSIGEGAFENCSELTSTNLNANDKIGLNNNVFKNCQNLKTIYNTNCISSIGDYTFASCYNFPQQITLPECTEIGRYAFLSCENLSNLTARKCTFVDYNAFYGTKLWDIEPSEV